MSEFTSYYLYQRYEKRGSQGWIPCVPNVYSITGDTSIPMPVSIKSECDPQCGCSTVQYRWTNIDPSIDWICDGTSKYYKQRREVSYDGGTTWIPLDEYQKGSLIEASSSDCTSPTPTLYRWVQTEDTVCVENANSTYTKYYVYKKQQQVNGQWVDVSPAVTKPDGYPLGTYDTLAQCQGTSTLKFSATYLGGSEYEIPCDGNTTLTSGETRPSGYNYTGMTNAEIGRCVTSIDVDAFYNCTNLSTVIFESNSQLNVIEDYAFFGCTSLTSITFPKSLTNLQNDAFQNCTGLTSVTFEEGSQLELIRNGVFANCSGLTSIDIPYGVTALGVGEYCNVFEYCTSLTSVTIPNTVTYIGNNTFRHCTSLPSITLPTGLTSITSEVFYDCSSLTSIVIPDSVTSIGNHSFMVCTSLTSVTIGSGVTSIGDRAFYGCSSLTSVTCLATTPPTLNQNYGGVFNGSTCPIYVPSASLSQYQSSWSDYSSRIQAIP